MNYRSLSNRELFAIAYCDPRYLTDPLFAELAARTAGIARVGYDARHANSGRVPEPIPTDGGVRHAGP